eukprot:Gb_04338 [translate_table: standard]
MISAISISVLGDQTKKGMRSPKRFRGRSGIYERAEANRSEPISLPRWARLQSDRYELGTDFPAGPYNRMVGRLHPAGGQPMEYMHRVILDPRLYLPGGEPVHSIDRARLDIPPARFYGAGHLPRHDVDEARWEDEIARLYSAGGPPIHRLDEPRLDGLPSMFYSENEARLDAMHARLYSRGGQHVHGIDGARVDNELARLHSADGHPIDRINEQRLDSFPAGIIFMCSKTTKKDCFELGLFGLSMMHRQLVERVVPGTKLFLFEFDTRELHGIFEADSNGGINLDSKAFGGSFPAQVRFKIYKECKPLAEKDFKKAIQDNYYKHNKFNLELTSQQVVNLVQMFCRGDVPENRGVIHSMSLPDYPNALGLREHYMDPSQSQHEFPLDSTRYSLAAQNLVRAESYQPSEIPVPVAREFQPPFVDAQGLQRENPMEDPRVRPPAERLWDSYPPPIEDFALVRPGVLSRPSARGLEINEVPYMNDRGEYRVTLGENSRLVQAPIVPERDPQSYFGESPRFMNPPLIEQPRSMYHIDTRSRNPSLAELTGRMHPMEVRSHDPSLVEQPIRMHPMEVRSHDPSLVEQPIRMHPMEMRSHTHVNMSEEPLRGERSNLHDRELGQSSFVGSQRDSMLYSEEPSREMHSALVEQPRSMHRFDTALQNHANALEEPLQERQAIRKERDYLIDQRVDNNHHTSNASFDEFQDSVHCSYLPNSDLRSWGTDVQGQRFRIADMERANFRSLESLQDSVHPSSYAPNPGLQSLGNSVEDRSDLDREKYNIHSRATVMTNSYLMEQDRFWDGRDCSNPVQGDCYKNESDVARQQRSEYLERVYHMYQQELAEETNNGQVEELHSPQISQLPGQGKMQIDVVGLTEGNQPAFHDHLERLEDASGTRSYKRAYEDLATNTSNSYEPRKRMYSYGEPSEDRAVEERTPANGAITSSLALYAGNNIGESSLRPPLSDPPLLPNTGEPERSFRSRSWFGSSN